MEEKSITNQESLDIITVMIAKAKKNAARGGSYYFLMWGIVVTLANLGHWYLEVFTSYSYPYIVWLITIPAVVMTIVKNRQRARNSNSIGHFDHLYGHIWIGVSVGMIITLAFMFRIDFNSNPIILILAGGGTYMTGQILRFKPLIFGSIMLWLGAVIAFTMPIADQYLVGAIAILLGYLIPGFMLKRAEGE